MAEPGFKSRICAKISPIFKFPLFLIFHVTSLNFQQLNAIYLFSINYWVEQMWGRVQGALLTVFLTLVEGKKKENDTVVQDGTEAEDHIFSLGQNYLERVSGDSW